MKQFRDPDTIPDSDYRCGLVSQADSVKNSGVMGAMSWTHGDAGDHWSEQDLILDDIGHHPSMIIASFVILDNPWIHAQVRSSLIAL